jgi:NAD(P)-dependent dehydrogenase (short-subunit alcohol dehydrogenase family)
MELDVTAFVTGASQGIGREIAVNLAEKGADVALAARSVDGLEETAQLAEKEEGAGETHVVRTDVSDEASVEDSVQETVDVFGGLDCLVNNAGIAGPMDPFYRIDADDWDEVQDVNAKGPFLCAKHTVDHLRESEQASIINVASVAGKRPYPNRAPYAASKMALIGLTRTLAFELGKDGITVNAVCPGAVQGDRINRAIEAQAELEQEDGVRTLNADPDNLALGKLFVEKKDIAEQVAYLASDVARNTTAQDINVGGGVAWY